MAFLVSWEPENPSNEVTRVPIEPPPPNDSSIVSNLLSTDEENAATLPIPTIEPLIFPVTSNAPAIVILVAPGFWVMMESPMWFSPKATWIEPEVIPDSSPRAPVFLGPAIKIAELYSSPLPDGWTYTQWLFNESHNNEPLIPWFEPESATLTPPNRTAGVEVLRLTMFVPISTADAVMFCRDEEPCTIKFWVM